MAVFLEDGYEIFILWCILLPREHTQKQTQIHVKITSQNFKA